MSVMESASLRQELPVRQIDTFHVLDYDRTLGNVGAALTRLYMVCDQVPGVSIDAIKKAQQMVENDGGSFDPLSMVKQMAGFRYDDMRSYYMRLRQPDLLYPDAQPFLNTLKEKVLPHCIMTYGVNPEWQRLKIAGTPYEGFVDILSHSDKGKVLKTWRGQDGVYRFTGYDANGAPLVRYEAEHLMLVDDKPQSLQDLPPNCQGVYLRRTGEKRLPSQIAAEDYLDSSVTTIGSLGELMLRPRNHDTILPQEFLVASYRPSGTGLR